MQFLLNKHGVRVPVNAYMDRPTVKGLKRYQRAMHLSADGVAGPATFTALGLQTRVPVSVSQVQRSSTVRLRPGDSLTAIARKHGISLSTDHQGQSHSIPAHPWWVKLRYQASVSAAPAAVSATNAVSVRD